MITGKHIEGELTVEIATNDIITAGLSVLAIVFSFGQFVSERTRSRKEATIHAFDQLEEAVFSQEEYKKLVIRAGEEYALKTNTEQKTSDRATLLLSQIEHFAVGVNSKIYDIVTLNRMAGSFVIQEFKRWKPIIETKRKEKPETKHYDEFEKLYKSLIGMRKITGFLAGIRVTLYVLLWVR